MLLWASSRPLLTLTPALHLPTPPPLLVHLFFLPLFSLLLLFLELDRKRTASELPNLLILLFDALKMFISDIKKTSGVAEVTKALSGLF